MKNNTYLFIDFDSTFITSETLEELALLALKDHPKKEEIYQKIHHITNLGMEGHIPFEESLKRRVKLIKANRSDINKTIRLLKTKVTPSIERNKRFFLKNRDYIYIISGAFKECILPVVKPFGITENHVLANTFTFDDKGFITGIDKNNPLTRKNGKYAAVKLLGTKGCCYVIGDGYTDYQIKELGAADYFVAYTENVVRKSIIDKADYITSNFDDFLNQLKIIPNADHAKDFVKSFLTESVNRNALAVLENE